MLGAPARGGGSGAEAEPPAMLPNATADTRTSAGPSGNVHVFCPRAGPRVPWADRPHRLRAGFAYLDGALRALESEIGPQGLTFFIKQVTIESRDLTSLPRYGNDVVAILVGDEWARPIHFGSRVRAAFKEYGVTLARPDGISLADPIRSLLSAAQFSRNLAVRTPLLLRSLHGAAVRHGPPAVPIPLGYLNQRELPIRPFDQRDVDVCFAGSVAHERYRTLSPQRVAGTVKSRSRAAMLNALERFRARNPRCRIDVGLTASYRSSADGDMGEYADRLMRARICLCPRGMSLETYRYFEAMRYGCIVIAERCPDHWFYRESPAIVVNEWTRLEGVLSDLLGDPDRMRRVHAASLTYWTEVCSERALAKYMAGILAATAVRH